MPDERYGLGTVVLHIAPNRRRRAGADGDEIARWAEAGSPAWPEELARRRAAWSAHRSAKKGGATSLRIFSMSWVRSGLRSGFWCKERQYGGTGITLGRYRDSSWVIGHDSPVLHLCDETGAVLKLSGREVESAGRFTQVFDVCRALADPLWRLAVVTVRGGIHARWPSHVACPTRLEADCVPAHGGLRHYSRLSCRTASTHRFFRGGSPDSRCPAGSGTRARAVTCVPARHAHQVGCAGGGHRRFSHRPAGELYSRCANTACWCADPAAPGPKRDGKVFARLAQP
jgi:hypothetical protein